MQPPSPPPSPPTDTAPPNVSDGGVDLTLVHWMLSLTPRERLAWCQTQADAIRTLRALQRRAP
jgi:hypothetical protein